MDLEQEVECPVCWERTPVVLDPVEGEQSFVEDCSVCCRPMTVRCCIDADAVTYLTVEPAN